MFFSVFKKMLCLLFFFFFKLKAILNNVLNVIYFHIQPDENIGLLFSAFMIGDGKLLTNAHCVEYNTQVKVVKVSEYLMPSDFFFKYNHITLQA